MGTMSFCIESAVEAVGGEAELDPGDVILMNDPYKTGSHPQDAALVMPVFLDDGTLIGYTAIKAHWLDIGAKELYCTDTPTCSRRDENFPGVKLYPGASSSPTSGAWRANWRRATYVEGDIHAQVAGVRTGALRPAGGALRPGALLRVRGAHVRPRRDGGATTLRRSPTAGTSAAARWTPTASRTTRSRSRSCWRSRARRARSTSPAPGRAPRPGQLPAGLHGLGGRVVMTMLAGGGEAPNEGHFRPIEVATRPGSMFHCLSPSPCFLYGWPAMQATEAVLNAVAEAVPERWPARAATSRPSSGGASARTRASSGATARRTPSARAPARTATAVPALHHIEAATRFAPMEVWEARNPWLMERFELAPDSGGPGRFRGGLGPDMHFTSSRTPPARRPSSARRTRPGGWPAGCPAGRTRCPAAS